MSRAAAFIALFFLAFLNTESRANPSKPASLVEHEINLNLRDQHVRIILETPADLPPHEEKNLLEKIQAIRSLRELDSLRNPVVRGASPYGQSELVHPEIPHLIREVTVEGLRFESERDTSGKIVIKTVSLSHGWAERSNHIPRHLLGTFLSKVLEINQTERCTSASSFKEAFRRRSTHLILRPGAGSASGALIAQLPDGSEVTILLSRFLIDSPESFNLQELRNRLILIDGIERISPGKLLVDGSQTLSMISFNRRQFRVVRIEKFYDINRVEAHYNLEDLVGNERSSDISDRDFGARAAVVLMTAGKKEKPAGAAMLEECESLIRAMQKLMGHYGKRPNFQNRSQVLAKVRGWQQRFEAVRDEIKTVAGGSVLRSLKARLFPAQISKSLSAHRAEMDAVLKEIRNNAALLGLSQAKIELIRSLANGLPDHFVVGEGILASKAVEASSPHLFESEWLNYADELFGNGPVKISLAELNGNGNEGRATWRVRVPLEKGENTVFFFTNHRGGESTEKERIAAFLENISLWENEFIKGLQRAVTLSGRSAFEERDEVDMKSPTINMAAKPNHETLNSDAKQYQEELVDFLMERDNEELAGARNTMLPAKPRIGFPNHAAVRPLIVISEADELPVNDHRESDPPIESLVRPKKTGGLPNPLIQPMIVLSASDEDGPASIPQIPLTLPPPSSNPDPAPSHVPSSGERCKEALLKQAAPSTTPDVANASGE